MSQAIIAEIVAIIREELVVNQAIYATVALIIYEHLITLDREIEHIWSAEWSPSRCLFIANRYILLLYAVKQTLPVHSLLGCQAVSYVGYVLGGLQVVILALFSGLRAYAFCSRKTVIPPLIIVALSLLPLATNIYFWCTSPVIFVTDGAELGPLGNVCGSETRPSDVAAYRNLTLASRISVIVADVLVVALTWRKTFRTSMEAMRSLKGPTRFVTVVLRDGTIYFIVMLAMNIAVIVLMQVSATKFNDPVLAFIQSLVPILISRFLLNLRKVTGTFVETDQWPSDDTYTGGNISPKLQGKLKEPLNHDDVDLTTIHEEEEFV